MGLWWGSKLAFIIGWIEYGGSMIYSSLAASLSSLLGLLGSFSDSSRFFLVLGSSFEPKSTSRTRAMMMICVVPMLLNM